MGRTEELIEICRAIWRREPLVHDGPHYHISLPEGEGLGLGKPLKLIDYPDRLSILSFVAASGPRNVRSATRVADGQGRPVRAGRGDHAIGPACWVRDRLAAYAEAGVTVLNIRPLGPDPVGTIARVRDLLG